MSLRSLLLAVALFSVLFASSAPAADYRYGPVAEQYMYNCLYPGPSYALFSDAWAAYQVGAGSPRVGEVYYVLATFAVIGNSCHGGADVISEFVLPHDTVTAISAEHPVRCAVVNYMTGARQFYAEDGCPQDLVQGSYGWAIHQPSRYYYPLAAGYQAEFYVPVLSKRTLSGTAANERLQTPIFALTDTSFWTFPSVGVTVFANPPTVDYPNLPATEITANTATLHAEVQNHFTSGSASVEYGTSTSYGKLAAPQAIGDVNVQSVAFALSELTPETEYHWRVRFTAADGAQTVGADQRFSTLALPRVAFTVTSSEGGQANADPSGATVPVGSVVRISATPSAGFVFGGWTVNGADAGSENPISLRVDVATEVRATFQVVPAPPPATGTPTPPRVTTPTPTPPAASEESAGCSAGGIGTGWPSLALVISLTIARRRRVAPSK